MVGLREKYSALLQAQKGVPMTKVSEERGPLDRVTVPSTARIVQKVVFPH